MSILEQKQSDAKALERDERRLSEGSLKGFRQLGDNIRQLPTNFRHTLIRHGAPVSPRSRSQAVMANFFLHVHAVRTHRWSLKKAFTLGLGIASLGLFIILIVTGVMLMVYFKPTTAEAYNSIKDIHYVIPGGRLLRNVHRWAANLMVISVMLHMARVFYTASYQKPREFNWMLGISLLVLTFALAFTGYCLPWDQLAYWALVIGSNIAASPTELTDILNITPYFDPGVIQRRVLLGSDIIGDDALLRFYWLHCIALPLAMTAILALHIWRIRKDGGMSRPQDISPDELKNVPKDAEQVVFPESGKTYSLMCVVHGRTPLADNDTSNTVSSWPHAFRAEMAVFACILAAVLFLGIFFDAPLKEAANPFVPENPAKAPWYFLGLQEIVSYSAFIGGVGIPMLIVLALTLTPFLDREQRMPGRWPQHRELRWAVRAAFVALFACVGVLAFRVKFGWLRDWNPDINQLWIILINPGTLLLALYGAYALYVLRTTGSTRFSAIVLFTCFLVFYATMTYFGTVHRGPYWEFYWWPSQWPVHETL